jgi:hypothetical protein
MTSSEYRSKCNCGREGKFSVSTEDLSQMSCNKYAQCPTYEELEKNSGELFKDLMRLLDAFCDQSNYKEGSEYSNRSLVIFEDLKKKYLLD